MTDEELRIQKLWEKTRIKLWEVEQELAEANYIIAKGADEITRQEWEKRIRTKHFRAFKEMASRCIDDQGKVQWDFLEHALLADHSDGRVTMIPRRADEK